MSYLSKVWEQMKQVFPGTSSIYYPPPRGRTSGSLRAMDEKNRVIRQKFSTLSDKWLGNLFFHEGDPLGEWTVTVVVSDEEIFSMKFQVYEEIIIGNSRR